MKPSIKIAVVSANPTCTILSNLFNAPIDVPTQIHIHITYFRRTDLCIYYLFVRTYIYKLYMWNKLTHTTTQIYIQKTQHSDIFMYKNNIHIHAHTYTYIITDMSWLSWTNIGFSRNLITPKSVIGATLILVNKRVTDMSPNFFSCCCYYYIQ